MSPVRTISLKQIPAKTRQIFQSPSGSMTALYLRSASTPQQLVPPLVNRLTQPSRASISCLSSSGSGTSCFAAGASSCPGNHREHLVIATSTALQSLLVMSAMSSICCVWTPVQNLMGLAAVLQDIDAEYAHVHAIKDRETLTLENGFVALVGHARVDNDTDQATLRLRK